LKESSDGETLIAVGMFPDLSSSRGESMMSKVGFYPGNIQEGLARGTK